MYKENLKKVKKYLFFISILFVVLINIHLFYEYLYFQAKQTPIKGGIVSEGINLEYSKLKFNPLMFGKKQKQDYIMSFLYRSLLTYDPEKKQIVSDLAKCDFSDLSTIKCILNGDVKWSNGEKITSRDVLATYKILKDKAGDLNKLEYSYLKDTSFYSTDKNTIIFKLAKKDINFITTVLFQPILSEKLLNEIGEKQLFGKFDLENSIFSGEYVFDGIVEEENSGILKMKLKKNPYYNGKKSYIDSYVFKFSSDAQKLLANVNIFDNKDGIIRKKSGFKFNKNKYYTPSFTALFINGDKVKNEKFRNYLLSLVSRENIINLVSKRKNVKQVENPYFLDGYSIDKNNFEFNLEEEMKNYGYFKKQYFLKQYLDTKLDEKQETSTGTIEKPQKNNQEKLKYIISDKIKSNINFISGEVVLEGKLNGETPKKVIINHNGRDIELKSLAKNNFKKFYFALRGDYNTLTPGKNIYKLYFDNKENLKEIFYVFYDKDLKKLEEYRKQAKNIGEDKEQKEIKEKQKQKDTQFLAKIRDLDDNLFYDKDLNPYTLKINYIDSEINNIVVENIINKMKDSGIVLKAVPVSLTQLIKKISSGNKDYDLLLTKINLSYFKFNISRYFYSGASKNGFNFSNLRSSKLDTLLEELNSNFYDEKQQKQKQYEVLKILKEKQVVKTLYSIENTQFVDKMVKNYSLPLEIPSYFVVRNLFKNIYTKSKDDIDWDKKSFSGYINFLKSILKK